jgi:molecular chaperone GrpE
MSTVEPGDGPALAGEGPDESAVRASPVGEAGDSTREVEELREKNLRLMAEMRNLQQRFQREREDALRYAEADFAREMLLIADDLERTLAAVTNADEASSSKLLEGVRIVYDHFQKVLRGRRIEPIEAVGQPFDPHEHEALMQQPSDKHPPGTVMAESVRGYRMHTRVLRPSKVVVSSGPGPG